MQPTNIKDNKRVAVMHGEVCFKPVDKMPAKGKRMKDYIAGHSETGHHHVLKGDSVILERKGKRWAFLEDVTELEHQKTYDIHEAQFLAPGAYEIHEKTEYNPFTKVIQRVFD